MEPARQVHSVLRPALQILRQDQRHRRFRRIPLSFPRHPLVSRPLTSFARPSLQKPSLLWRALSARRLISSPQARWHTSSSEAEPATATASPATPPVPTTAEDGPTSTDVPAYELQFTCKPCSHRSTHRVSKQGYLWGTVIITCPNCQARHLISDHLKIFRDKSVTIEDILREKGELFKKGQLDPTGDFELWNDGSKTKRQREESPRAAQTGEPEANVPKENTQAKIST